MCIDKFHFPISHSILNGESWLRQCKHGQRYMNHFEKTKNEVLKTDSKKNNGKTVKKWPKHRLLWNWWCIQDLNFGSCVSWRRSSIHVGHVDIKCNPGIRFQGIKSIKIATQLLYFVIFHIFSKKIISVAHLQIWAWEHLGHNHQDQGKKPP